MGVDQKTAIPVLIHDELGLPVCWVVKANKLRHGVFAVIGAGLARDDEPAIVQIEPEDAPLHALYTRRGTGAPKPYDQFVGGRIHSHLNLGRSLALAESDESAWPSRGICPDGPVAIRHHGFGLQRFRHEDSNPVGPRLPDVLLPGNFVGQRNHRSAEKLGAQSLRLSNQTATIVSGDLGAQGGQEGRRKKYAQDGPEMLWVATCRHATLACND